MKKTPIKKIKSPKKKVSSKKEVLPVDYMRTREEKEKIVVELRTKGHTYKEIYQKTGIPKPRISIILKRVLRETSRAFNLQKNPLVPRGEIVTKISSYAPEALDMIQRLSRRSKKDEVKLSASKDIMDRAGFKPVERHAHLHMIDEMSRDELLQGFRNLMSEMKTGATVLVEPTKVEEK